ncbi:hypothetical protein Sango_2104200 [Sesamum angolense]|uniref:Uncharacterized protein n=1 Tax=Sesamum angolense TaxID=2727404 RepID=A0AAE2BM47_9LAMI|nr:hypothetical protein Sango_2104200 [Sesamum angolense]
MKGPGGRGEVEVAVSGVLDQSKMELGPQSPIQISKRGLGLGTIVRTAASVASTAAKHAYAAASSSRPTEEEMLPLKCCLMSISLPWENIAHDLLFKNIGNMLILILSSECCPSPGSRLNLDEFFPENLLEKRWSLRKAAHRLLDESSAKEEEDEEEEGSTPGDGTPIDEADRVSDGAKGTHHSVMDWGQSLSGGVRYSSIFHHLCSCS